MTIFTSSEALAAGHAGVTKWDRLLTALAQGTGLTPGQAHSVGDSLTYWRADSASLASPQMTGHRRYQTVLAVLDGACRVRTAAKTGLVTTEAYCDLSDAELFAAPGLEAADYADLTCGQILAVPIDHAWQVAPLPHADLLIVHLTVEGATFHNK